MNAPPPRWTVPAWERFVDLRHGFFGRAGGVSAGVFASLNCSTRVGDDPAAVEENRLRVAAALGQGGVRLPGQVHGDRVAIAGDAPAGEADALVSDRPGEPVGVLTADCVPLLLIVPERRVAAAVHAGWKGTALGIAARAVEALAACGGAQARAVHAALGPAIGSCCYEVGDEVASAIAAGAGGDRVPPARRDGGKSWIDLRAINAEILRIAGVPEPQIHVVGPCTRCAGDQCFSHRGTGGGTGRQISAVAWS